ncbi:MAG: thiamine pyrophosphate-dependent dehydrogenase E1 component subunit alpha [Chloroflexota bacterium]|nr:thiamine pyrophosphate-dependent dehydrogenase E1 component subunit alpha [Chloroflexota bacterium]
MTGTSERVVTASPGHAALGLSDEQAVGLYRTMLLARAVDERQWILNRQGRQAFVISCQGHEAAQVGSAAALRRGRDVMVPYYRDTAAAIAFGATPLDCLLEALSRANGPWTGGRMMPSHFSSPALKILTGSSSVGSHIPHATGAALAAKLRGEDSVALAYFGDGATAAGNFHEGISFAAIHRLPAIFFCENNGLAISTRPELEMPVGRVADRASAYGIPGVVVDGTDILAVYAATREAVERARRGEGPTLIDAPCVRLTPHSSDDDHTRYRSGDELDAARARDPIPRYAWYLREYGLLDDAADGCIKQEVTAEVEAALQAALSAPAPDPATALDHVLAERSSSGALDPGSAGLGRV